MMPHTHDETGAALFADAPPDPAEVEAEAIRAATKTEADAEVRIAEIEAATALELAKLERTALTDEERLELEALRAECEVLRAEVAAAAGPADELPAAPEVVEVQADEPAPEPGQPTAPPEHEGGSPAPEAKRKRAGLGMW